MNVIFKKYSPSTWLTLAVFCAAAFLVFFNLGKGAFLDYDEAQYAQIIHESIGKGVYSSFTLFEVPWFEKPPLLFWSIFGSVKIFGETEFAMRLPSALSTLGVLIFTYLLAFELSRRRGVAILAAFILLTIPVFWGAARQVRFDVPVTFFLLGAIYSFLKGWKDKRFYIGVGIFLGLAILTKSIVGLFVIPLIFILSFFYREFSWIKSKYFYSGLFLGGLILIPWHVYETYVYGKRFWNSYLLDHVFNRFSKNILAGESSNFIYLSSLWKYANPWFLATLLFIPTLPFLRKNKKVDLRPHMAIASSLLFILAVFFIAQTKLVFYIIPAYPFLAIFVALMSYEVFLKAQSSKFKKILNFPLSHFAITFFIFLGTFAVINSVRTVLHFSPTIFSTTQDMAEEERKVGNIISESGEDLPVYAFGYHYWDTVKYYSGRNIDPFDPKRQPLGSYYLILPNRVSVSGVQKKSPGQEIKLEYEGKYLKLMKWAE